MFFKKGGDKIKISGQVGWCVLTLVLSAVTATVFGFVAGYFGSALGWSQSLSVNVPRIGRLGMANQPVGTSGYTLPQVHNALRPVVTEQQSVISAVKKASPAVVSIVISKDVPVYEQTNPQSDFFQQFFGNIPGMMMPTPQYQQKGTQKQDVGAGSGFIVSADGYLITNRHVVDDEKADYTVIMADKSKHEAKIIGRDQVNDIAVLKIDGKNLTHLSFGDSDKIEVGQSVIAIGNTLGRFGNTVSTGVVSGLRRSLSAGDGMGMNEENLFDVIQTDAAINPGNSGGPLIDLEGKVIGVNVAIVQGSQNIGFALPINDIKKVFDGVKTSGHISRPFLGVRFQLVTKELQKANQLSVDYGALVVRGDAPADLAVSPGSPADLAGIVENDILLEIDGQKITEEMPLQILVSKYGVGDTIKIKLLHKGQEKTVEAKLTERKP